MLAKGLPIAGGWEHLRRRRRRPAHMMLRLVTSGAWPLAAISLWKAAKQQQVIPSLANQRRCPLPTFMALLLCCLADAPSRQGPYSCRVYSAARGQQDSLEAAWQECPAQRLQVGGGREHPGQQCLHSPHLPGVSLGQDALSGANSLTHRLAIHLVLLCMREL